MPNAPKDQGHENPPKTGNHLPFEEALKKLETIVEQMESDDLPLDTLLARYEEGRRLSAICQEKLAAAEVRIQQLEQTASGDLKLKPLSQPVPPGE